MARMKQNAKKSMVGHATRARRGLAGFERGCIYVGLLMGRSILPACSCSCSSRLMAPTLVLSAVVLQRAGTVVLPPSTPHAPHVPPHAPRAPYLHTCSSPCSLEHSALHHL